MNIKTLPSQEYLLKLFYYDADTGNLHRKISVSSNTKVGDKVGYINNNGYRQVRINDKIYMVHRLIYKIKHGFDPDYADHIDGNPLNNKIENLRSVTHQENCRNQKKRKDNISGVTGVYWNKSRKKWRARLMVNSKELHLGYFENKKEAVNARKKAEKKHGFHKNHGRGK